MRTITETDIVALRAKAQKRTKPRTKTGIEGLEYVTSNDFPVTREAIDILTDAGQCHDAFYAFCKQADRSARYYKGEQWSDTITMKDRCGCVKTMTEEDYIKSQGRPALKQNLIRPIIRNVLSQFRSAPYKSVVFSSDEGGQNAADQMSVKLNDVLRYNNSAERDAREYETFLVTGAGIFYVGYAFDAQLQAPMPFYQAIDYHRYFQNPDATDVAGKDVSFCGDYIDIPLSEVKGMYAHNLAQAKALENIYNHENRIAPVFSSAFVEPDPAAESFLGGPYDGRCRVIRVCRLEGDWDITVHDYADASFETYSKREFPNKEEEIQREIARRKRMASDMGLDYDDPGNRLLLVYETKYVRKWMYYHLSPYGHVLWQQECPYQHNSHCYAAKFYPLFQGQVYGMAYDLIDQQRMINRMFILTDFMMDAAAKGVLLVPEDSIPDDMDIEDFAEEWTKYRGVIKIKTKDGVPIPQQVVGHQVNIGQFDIINLMMRLMTDISGVHDAMQGKTPTAGTPASLYAQETNNARLNTLDYVESYSWLLEQRDYKLIQIIQQFSEDSYSPAPEGASEEAKRYVASEVRKYKLRNQIRKSVDTAVVRLYNEQLMATMLMNGAISLKQYQESGAKPFGDDLMQKLEQAQAQLQNGQGVSQQQLAQIQAALPQGTPEGMAQAARLLQGQPLAV